MIVSKFNGALALSMLFVLLAPACFSEEGPVQPVKNGKEGTPEQKPTRDPTQPSNRLKQALKSAEKPVVVAHSIETSKLPEIVLKGVVENNQGEGAAILQISGNMFTVRKNSEFSVTASDGNKLSVVVRKISNEGVQIEVPVQKLTVNIR